jgi:uroporphyrinogen-III synthase
MPLEGKRVLVTRPDGNALAEVLRRHGAQVTLAPAIRFAPPADPRPALDALRAIDRYAWCVLASAQAVAAFFELCDLAPAAVPASLRFAAVGPKTKAALEARGCEVALMPDSFNARAAGEALAGALRPGTRVLIVRAQDGGSEIVDRLRAAGCTVDAVAGYRTLAVDDPSLAAAAAASDVWTFASASAVDGLAANVAEIAAAGRGKIVACIGASCAAAARGLGLHVDVVAPTSTAEGLVEALETHLA